VSSQSADVCIIGAGISGLVDAILMAETGRKVVVLEQHSIPGGYLQQFKRKRTVFDVGFHYMGSTQAGHPMRQFMEHLSIWERVKLIPFPEQAAIEVRNGERSFAYPGRFDLFKERALSTWPHERAALERLFADTQRVAQAFKWFALKRGVEYQHPADMDFEPVSFAEYASFIEDPWLKEVLAFQTFNLGLFAHEAPWVKHTLAFRSNFDLTCRIEGGGGGMVEALVARGRELGVEYFFKREVMAIESEGKRATEIRTTNGEVFAADTFIAACHPKPILRCIDDKGIKPMFKQRIFDLKDSRGAVQLFLRLRAPARSIGATCIMLRDEAEESHELSMSPLLITNPSAVDGGERGGPRLEAMTYAYSTAFEPWRDQPVLKRGPEYAALKDELAQRAIAMIAKVAPEVPDLIEDVYTATPLSDWHYTSNEHGAVFGISHDVSQQGSMRPMPRMRLRNLFFTGHSINMPGICGVFINAFDTCDLIRDDGVLFDAVAT
jgi:all-trans-retinol 13,14-reductase